MLLLNHIFAVKRFCGVALTLLACVAGSLQSASASDLPWQTPGWEKSPVERIALPGSAVSVSLDPNGRYVAAGLQYPFELNLLDIRARKWMHLDTRPYPDPYARLAWLTRPCTALFGSSRGTPLALRAASCGNAKPTFEVPLVPDDAEHSIFKVIPIESCGVVLVRWRGESYPKVNKISYQFGIGNRSGVFVVDKAKRKLDDALGRLFPERLSFVGANVQNCTVYFGVQRRALIGNRANPFASTDVYAIDLKTKSRRKLFNLDRTDVLRWPAFPGELEVSPSAMRAVISTSRYAANDSRRLWPYFYVEALDLTSGRVTSRFELPQPGFGRGRFFHYQWLDDRFFLLLSGPDGMFLADAATGALRHLDIPQRKGSDGVVDFSYVRETKKLAVANKFEVLLYDLSGRGQ